MSAGVLVLIVLAYVLLLFAVGRYGERVAVHQRVSAQPLVWSMALAVYCTSWTYYGAVGGAASSAWSYLPIYLGPALVFLFATPMIGRMMRLAKRHRLTSLADFIAARHDHAPRIAALVTAISVLAVLPYIALQLKAISDTFAVIALHDSELGWDVALMAALGLGVFAILFGTRHISASESHRGLTLAIAFESVFKLLILVIIAAAAIAIAPAISLNQAAQRMASEPPDIVSFAVHTVLAALAIICLPRQFHITVVENTHIADLQKARWYFPAYLLLVSLVVVPLAELGRNVLAADVPPDSYVLQLPLWMDQQWLAVLAYLGGFAAATGMIVVSTIALSIMLSNELLMPWLLQSGRLSEREDLGHVLKRIRRFSIVVILALAYAVYRSLGKNESLAGIGLIAFVGIAQLAPALIGAMYWRRASLAGASAGLFVGLLVWSYCLLLPAILPQTQWVQAGPFGIELLRPYGFLGWLIDDPVVHASILSLGLNSLLYVLLPMLKPAGLQESLATEQFLEAGGRRGARKASVADLKLVLERFFGTEQTATLLAAYPRAHEAPINLQAAQAPPELIDYIESLLAGAMGGSTAKALMDAMLGARAADSNELAQVLEQTSSLLRFNRELLQSALDNLSQAVSVVDANQRLVAWNRRYKELFALPDQVLRVGEPIESILRLNAERGLLGPGDAEAQIQKRLQHLKAQSAHRSERQLPDGRVLDVQGQPMPEGGFVTSFTDISELKQIQADLQASNVDLEQRVNQRTEALRQAQSEAEQANLSKTRFLAAASHDLMQPLNAARLFASAAKGDAGQAQLEEMLDGVGQSLQSMEELLASLLDISKLDAGVVETKIQPVALTPLFSSLEQEFSMLMQAKGLALHVHPSSLWVLSDEALLRRLLRNFLSNAMRYTSQGRVVLGVRRLKTQLRIEVLDTGAGIAEQDQLRIFDEFSRLRAGEEPGFGLGLAICRRLARVLNHELHLRSEPGKGSAFCLSLPITHERSSLQPDQPPAKPARASGLQGLRVLCVDNDAQVLKASRLLLEQWGCVVESASNVEQALPLAGEVDIWLLDYHLDDKQLGTAVIDAFAQGPRKPCILITADHSGEADAAAAARDCHILKKPLKPAALRALLERLSRQL